MAQEVAHESAHAPGPDERVVAELRRRLLGDSISRERLAAADDIPAARRFWRALGFPEPQAWGELELTNADLDALDKMNSLVSRGVFDLDLALAMTRAIARSTDRLAVWQAQLVAETLQDQNGEAADIAASGPEAAAALLASFGELADELEPLMSYAWRRHLVGALTRIASDAAPDDPGTGTVRAVGFADLVNFTAVVRRASERQLAAMVQRFEQLASDIVTAHDGRVIKTVGDEVLFVAVEPLAGTAIALDLVDAMAEEPMLPQVRVGVAFGQVLSRMGDVFGTTVNRASRLTAVAPSGRVLVDESLAARLASLSGFDLHPLRRRHLRGIGMVTPSDVTRSRGARLPTALAGR